MLKWLHFSDVHVSASSEWDADHVRKALVADLQRLFERDRSLAPDFIFFTGDATFSGRRDEFAVADRFFADVRRACGVAPERFFIVPGNHDCKRTKFTEGTKAYINALAATRSHKRLADFYQSAEGKNDRAAILGALREYGRFAPAHCRISPSNFFWTHRPDPQPGDPPLVFIGLNTAWATYGDQFDPILGRYQIDAALRAADVSGDDVVFALMHHPPSSLADWDNDESGLALFSGAVHVVLHGHLHASAAWERLKTTLVFAAGSAYADSRYKNSYNLGQLDFTRGKGTLLVRRWFDAKRFWQTDLEISEKPPGQIHFAAPGNVRRVVPRPPKVVPAPSEVRLTIIKKTSPQRDATRRILGIDVGSAKIAARLLEVGPERAPIVCAEAIERSIERPAEAHLIQQLQSIIADVVAGGFTPDGIGIAVPGQVNLRTGALSFAPNLDVHYMAIRSEIQRGLLRHLHKNVEVRIDNDARCATRCELHLGVGRQYDSFVCIFFGNGVGSGIVIDRKIHAGHHFCAGEVGHHKLDLNGGPCNCGARGCFETFVNATAIVRRAEALCRRQPKKTMLSRVAGAMTTYNIADAAANGDPVAKEVLNEVGGLMGAGIANYVNILDPGAVVLGGGVINGFFQYMARAIHKGIDDNVLPELRSTAIVSSEYVDEAPAIGAALLFSPSETWTFAAPNSERPPAAASRARTQP